MGGKTVDEGKTVGGITVDGTKQLSMLYITVDGQILMTKLLMT